MSYVPPPGSGTLWKNTKGTSDKAPAYTGDITAHRDIKKGEKLRLAAWLKGGDAGKDKFLSLRMEDERERREQPAADPFG